MRLAQKVAVTFVSLMALPIGALQLAHSQEVPLSGSPNGEYFFRGSPSSELSGESYLLLRKWGRIVVGMDARLPLEIACFKGFIEDNKIVDATRVLPPYTPDADWAYQPGEMLDLDSYERSTEPSIEVDREMLEVCLQVFSR